MNTIYQNLEEELFMFKSVLDTTAGTTGTMNILLCLGVALILGIVISCAYMLTTSYTKNFVITLAVLPAMVQVVILMVNGNLGASVAVLGAFGLIRFRSVPGTSKDISTVFLAMAVGLATGTGYLVYGIVVTLLICLVTVALSYSKFGERKESEKLLKVTIPENLDYSGIFDDLFKEYARKVSLEKVRTTNMGSMYELSYYIVLKDIELEKKLIDAIRCRNGNLAISCGRFVPNREEL